MKKKYLTYKDREGNEILSKEYDTKTLKFLYHTFLGRMCLFFLTRRLFSKIVGLFLSSPFSKGLIKKFVRKNEIDLSSVETTKFKCYNDFFTRKLKPEAINIDKNPNHFVSPCDGKCTCFPITKNLTLNIKKSEYHLGALLNNEKLAQEYLGGSCIVLRLTVTDYHRYIYLDEGVKEKNYFIKGVLHTVQPIALETLPVFHRNCREYTILHTKNFSDVIQMEVGAMCVGKINNFHQQHQFQRGEEKGTFLFGGSTIVLFVKRGVLGLDKDLINNSKNGIETVVKIGTKIGQKLQKND